VTQRKCQKYQRQYNVVINIILQNVFQYYYYPKKQIASKAMITI